MIVWSVIALLLGVTTWSFLEYCIHRWLGHDRRFRPNTFAKEHVRHHIEGDYFAPWSKKLLAAGAFSVVAGVPALLVSYLAFDTLVVGLAYVTGLVAFYGFYEVLHRLEHVHAGIGPYGRWARRHHFAHHFVDARYNHGVTSPIWDVVFRTYRPAAHIAVPARLAMDWLVEPETGDVRPRFRDHWSIKGASNRSSKGAAPAPLAAA